MSNLRPEYKALARKAGNAFSIDAGVTFEQVRDHVDVLSAGFMSCRQLDLATAIAWKRLHERRAAESCKARVEAFLNTDRM